MLPLELQFDSWQWEEIFLFSKMFRPGLGSIYPPIEWGSFTRGNVARHEAITHSQSSAYFECG